MAWVKIDDQFSEHPKVAPVGPLGMALQVAALCYCNRQLTDGFVPEAVAHRLLWFGDLTQECNGVTQPVTPALVIGVLLDAKLWERTQGGYIVHDYLNYQPSREQVEAEREKTAKRVADWRERKRQEETDAENGESNAACNGVTNGEVTGAPVARSPYPVPDTKPREGQNTPAPAGAQRVYPPDFEAFWSAYPRKREKRAAFKAWTARIRERDGPTPDELVAAASHYANCCQRERTEERFIKHGATFLGANRPYEEFVHGPPVPSRSESYVMAQIAKEEAARHGSL